MADGLVAVRPVGQGWHLGSGLGELQGQAHAVAELEWVVSVDSTVARAHQHAAGAPKSRTGGWVEAQDPAA